MEELYKSIEEKIKASGYPRVISGEAVYGLKEKKMDHMFCFLNLKMMLSLNITLPLWMMNLILEC